MYFLKTEKHLWTDVEIQIVSDYLWCERIIKDLFLYCEDFEAEFSRFRPESALSQLNKEKKLIVSERFLRLFQLSIQLYKETNGLFSPFVDVSSLGYSHSFDQWIFEIIAENGTKEASYTLEWNILTLSEHTTLDFWWIGKGLLVDDLSKKLEEKGIENFCINAGGDLRVKGINNEGYPWGIGVEDPIDGNNCAVFFCQNCAVNTSGGYRRRWKIDDKSYHHIVDPRSGTNANEYASVTIIADSSAKADALTKVFWHIRKEEILETFAKYWVEWILIDKERNFFLSKNMEEKHFFRKL